MPQMLMESQMAKRMESDMDSRVCREDIIYPRLAGKEGMDKNMETSTC